MRSSPKQRILFSMSKAARYLPREEIKQVSARSDLKAAWLVLHAWGLILGSMALFAWMPNPLTFLIAVVIIGGRQLGLAVLMHDGSHGVLFKTRALNNWVSQWLCAYPVFSETWTYRAYHLKHHRFTQTDKDPDLSLSLPFPVTKASMRRKIIRDLTGQTAFKQRKAQVRAALGPKDLPVAKRAKHFISKLGGPILVNALLLSGLALAGHWYLYFALWLLPFVTWHQLIIRIRNIAEHAMVPDHDDIYLNARTTVVGPFIRTILAPYFVNYHVEHHMMMYVPCYNLPMAHKLLGARGFHEKIEIAHGYSDVLKLVTSKPEDDLDPNDGRGNDEHFADMYSRGGKAA